MTDTSLFAYIRDEFRRYWPHNTITVTFSPEEVWTVVVSAPDLPALTYTFQAGSDDDWFEFWTSQLHGHYITIPFPQDTTP